jgi:NAD+ diphosphatase
MGEPRYCLFCGSLLEGREHAGRARLLCARQGCGFVHYDNPLPVVAALVEHQGAVLLARNRGWPAGWFGLVTGFLERGETPEEGALRELKEELGLTGQVVKLIGVYPFPQRNELIVAFHVRASGEVVLGEEIEAIKRVAPEKLRAWPFGTGLAVSDWLKARGST